MAQTRKRAIDEAIRKRKGQGKGRGVVFSGGGEAIPVMPEPTAQHPRQQRLRKLRERIKERDESFKRGYRKVD